MSMPEQNQKQIWEEYRERELAGLLPVLTELGFELEKTQPHTGGERYLMQAVTTTSGRKLILIGQRRRDGKRVVIKATSDENGASELEHERTCRQILREINFAYKTFLSPEEILFTKKRGYVISIQAFIEQKCAFLERPLKEQFSLALKSFEAQESAHAATYGHMRLIKKTFGSMNAENYVQSFANFKKNILSSPRTHHGEAEQTLNEAEKLLRSNKETMEQYSRFLTHTDFVPHNIRVVGEDIYLLDHSSIRFGNKYEGWARFCNFMALYNPPLEKALVQYVKDNRSPEESLSLRLMRIYRLGEIIWYYTKTLDKSLGNLLVLNQKRVEFWSRVLQSMLKNENVPENVLKDYKAVREQMRSEEEKRRQIGLH